MGVRATLRVTEINHIYKLRLTKDCHRPSQAPLSGSMVWIKAWRGGKAGKNRQAVFSENNLDSGVTP